MAEVISVFAIIAALVILGFLAEILFRKTRIPDVLLLIGAGILIATGFGWASIESFGFGAQLFTTFALVFILFQGALNIDFRALFHSFGGTVSYTCKLLLTVVELRNGKFIISLPWPHQYSRSILGEFFSSHQTLRQNLTLKVCSN
jgi:NhaP-type Na+/H+ or K+/H+ antiporter